jgi:hypothetical protein
MVKKRKHPKQPPKQRMRFKDALDLVDEDMPDGAYFALAHEIAGLEYGEGFDELTEDDDTE